MSYIEGTDRDQLVLFEEKIDGMIEADNLVRFIDAYADKLDLKALEIHNIDNTLGAPGYRPALYLKIYIYCYLNKIRSSRKIERECQRNLELLWLTCRLAPDHWSISNFRKQNKAALQNIFKEFLKFCHQLNLISFNLVAVDGTKLRAQNSMSNVYKRSELEKAMKGIESKIEEYLAELEVNDKKEQDDYEFLTSNIPQKLKYLEGRKEKLGKVQTVFEENPALQRYFANDPDSSFQRDNGRCVVGYNCQTAVDEKNKLIVAVDVVQETNDLHQLGNMMGKVAEEKQDLKVEKKTLGVADAGYHTEAEILEVMEDKDLEVFIPHPLDVKKRLKLGKESKTKIPAKGFRLEDFYYDAVNDWFVCPKGQRLVKKWNTFNRSGVDRQRYHGGNCSRCPSKPLCTPSPLGRKLQVSVNFIKMDIFKKKITSDLGKRIIRKRKELAEHPFGTIKRTFGYTYFMQRGLEKVRSEFSFISFIYNFKRVAKIYGVKNLLDRLK